MAAARALALLWWARAVWVSNGVRFMDYEEPLDEHTDLVNYSHHTAHAAHAAFVEVEDQMEKQGVYGTVWGPFTDPASVGINPTTNPPYVPGATVSSFTEGWFGQPGNILDDVSHTVWATTQIPAMIEFDFGRFYRIESYEIMNGFPSGAARVRLYAWGGRNWLRISLNELISGEVKVTPTHPVFAAKVRMSFHTYHMGGVNISEVKFRGLSSRAVMSAMTKYNNPEQDQILKELMQKVMLPPVEPAKCPVLQRFPNPTIFELAMWASREKQCMCAHEMTDVLREPTAEERAMMANLRKGWVISKGMVASPYQMYSYVNETLNNVSYLGRPPKVPMYHANASYKTPYIPGKHGQGIMVHNLSLAELATYPQEKLLQVTLGDIAGPAHFQSYLETFGAQPEPLTADTNEHLTAQLAAGHNLPPEAPPPPPPPNPTPEDPTQPVDPEDDPQVVEHADGSVTSKPEVKAKEVVRDVKVVCLAMACMLHAMRHTNRGCQSLLQPLCEKYQQLTGCDVECDFQQMVGPDNGCLKLHRPLGFVGYNFHDMAIAANHIAEQHFTNKSRVGGFDYKKYLSEQGYDDYAPKEMLEQKRLRAEMENFKKEEAMKKKKEDAMAAAAEINQMAKQNAEPSGFLATE